MTESLTEKFTGIITQTFNTACSNKRVKPIYVVTFDEQLSTGREALAHVLKEPISLKIGDAVEGTYDTFDAIDNQKEVRIVSFGLKK